MPPTRRHLDERYWIPLRPFLNLTLASLGEVRGVSTLKRYGGLVDHTVDSIVLVLGYAATAEARCGAPTSSRCAS